VTESRLLPTPREMIEHLNRYVFGQERAKRDLAVAVYNHYLALAERELDGKATDFGKQHVLLLGATGSGKTYLVKTLARFLNVPLSFASATSLVETGYVGTPVDTIVKNLLTSTNYDARAAQRGIVFVDEIDKIRRSFGSSRDVSGEGVQNGLLTLLDGCSVTVKGRGNEEHSVDTSQILFICSGAFVELDAIVRERLGSAEIGFKRSKKSTERVGIQDGATVELPDLVKFGFIPEFVGRFATITALRALERDDLVNILKSTEESILLKQQRMFALHGITLEFTPDALTAIADEALKLGTGARGLTRTVLRVLDPVDYRMHELALEGVTTIEIGRDAVVKGSEPVLRKDPPVAGTTPVARVEELRKRALAAPPVVRVTTHNGSLAFTDTSRMKTADVLREVERVKQEIEWEKTAGAAREWWIALERKNQLHPEVVLRLLEELRHRKAGIADLYYASLHSGSGSAQAALHFLDYQRERDVHEARTRDASTSLRATQESLRRLVTGVRRGKVAKAPKTGRKPGRKDDGAAAGS
jgi:ATP-dependent Clp protease ATP-binding subunit ClpX